MKRPLFALLCVLLSASTAFSATRSTCPDKILETGSIEGIYRGTECGDLCHAAIELSNGEIFYLLAGEEEAAGQFGPGTGQRVSAEYKIEQFWNEYGNECSRMEVLVSGGRLNAAQGQQSPARTAAAASSPVGQVAPTGESELYMMCPGAVPYPMMKYSNFKKFLQITNNADPNLYKFEKVGNNYYMLTQTATDPMTKKVQVTRYGFREMKEGFLWERGIVPSGKELTINDIFAICPNVFNMFESIVEAVEADAEKKK
jgi:hypothetical protein